MEVIGILNASRTCGGLRQIFRGIVNGMIQLIYPLSRIKMLQGVDFII